MPTAARSLGAIGTGGDFVAHPLLLSTARSPGRTVHPRNCPCPGLPSAVSHLPQPFMPSAARSAVYRGTRISRDRPWRFDDGLPTPRYDRYVITRGERKWKIGRAHV